MDGAYFPTLRPLILSIMLEVVSVKDKGALFVRNAHNMIGQDGAYSIPTDAGLLFYFGDTVIGKRTKGESLWYPGGEAIQNELMEKFGEISGMVTNCGLLFKSESQFEYITDDLGRIKTLVHSFEHENPDKWRVWCMHGIQLGDKLYLFYIKVKMLPQGTMPVNFAIAGAGIAVGDTKSWDFTRLNDDGVNAMWSADEPAFSSAALDGKDGWIYLYGVRNENGNQRCYLARVRPDGIENRSNYTFWNGADWSQNINDIKPILFGMPNEMSVSWNNYLNGWLAVYSNGTDGEIVGCTAQNPEGPWSEPVLLHKVNLPHHGLPYPVLIYAAKEHPKLAKQNGKTLWITYIEFEEYYPHLLEIEIE